MRSDANHNFFVFPIFDFLQFRICIPLRKGLQILKRVKHATNVKTVNVRNFLYLRGVAIFHFFDHSGNVYTCKN